MQFIYEPGHIYVRSGANALLAEITFPVNGQGVADINHTFVDPSLRGQGVADALMRAALQQLCERGQKAVATCPYAVKWLAQHPKEAEILSK